MSSEATSDAHSESSSVNLSAEKDGHDHSRTPLQASSSIGKRKNRDEEDQGNADVTESRQGKCDDPGSSRSSDLETPPSKKQRSQPGEDGEDRENTGSGDTGNKLQTTCSTGKRKDREDTSEDAAKPLVESPSKRARVEKSEEEVPSSPRESDMPNVSSATDTSSAATCYLFTLPTELLNEILLLTGCPKYVLAMARTCKAFCNLLLAPEATRIWREVRKSYVLVSRLNQKVLRLPDPPEIFSEARYASFLFDSGDCDNCGRETDRMYASFALRVRICGHRKCWKRSPGVEEIPADILQHSEKVEAIITNEVARFWKLDQSDVTWPNALPRFAHQQQAQAILDAYPDLDNLSDEAKAEFERLKKRKKKWMSFCVELHEWKKSADKEYHLNRYENDILSKHIATRHGWDLKLLLETSVFGPYKRRKDLLMENINEADVNVMKDQIEEDMLSRLDKKSRRTSEINLMQNREDIKTYYHALRSNKYKYPILPSLDTFRRLPVISMLQSPDLNLSSSETPAASVADSLRDDKVIINLVETQLKKWVDNAKAELAVVLGVPKNWKSANKNVLHPVERITARFLCTRCKRMDHKYRPDEGLDFAGACLHECGEREGKKKGRKVKMGNLVWDPRSFVRDEKAIKVLKKAVDIFGFAEDREGANCLKGLGLAVICKSCDKDMVLDARSIAGHSRRHEDMEISRPSLETVTEYLGGYPYQYGLAKSLSGFGGFSEGGKMEINRTNFGCRHCLRAKQETEAAVASLQAGDAPASSANSAASAAVIVELSTVARRMHDLGIEGPLERPLTERLFNFNGLRSHLKEKHGLEVIRDEDLFCYQSVEFVYQ
ncbi:hypothetical protein CPC08DRAFT_702225 [Agrocybe pediades]|nr:hypothetical protein CPC08DRAFT_702225 [Agrocybe pediades]